MLFFLLPFIHVPGVLAAEVDNFTIPTHQLPDRSRELNTLANRYLGQVVKALDQANIGCNEISLYDALRQAFSNHFRGLLVDDVLKQKHFTITYLDKKESIYRDWSINNGFVLGSGLKKLTGLALSPVMRVGKVQIGVDKIEHFFGSGFRYYKKYYIDRKTIHQVLLYGANVEQMILGGNPVSSGVFSYADLTANFNGMRFWNNMLQKHDDFFGAHLNRGPYLVCRNDRWLINPSRPINFLHYIDDAFDESINCSKMATEKGYRKVRAVLASRGVDIHKLCAQRYYKIEQLIPKYSRQQVYRFILNDEGPGWVRKFGEIN